MLYVQQCRCLPMLILRAWATCVCVSKRENHSSNNAFWLVKSRDAHRLLLSPPGGLIYFKPIWGGKLNRGGRLIQFTEGDGISSPRGAHDSNNARYLFRVPMIHRFMTSHPVAELLLCFRAKHQDGRPMPFGFLVILTHRLTELCILNAENVEKVSSRPFKQISWPNKEVLVLF